MAFSLNSPRALLGLGEFIGGQALVWTPILFIVAIFVAVVYAQHYGNLRSVERLFFWCGILPLLFFGYASTKSHGEINWPAFAYFPLSLLMGRYLTENWQGNRVQWVRKGCEVALGFAIGIHVLAMPSVQQWLLQKHFHLTHQATDLWGWRDFGKKLAWEAEGMPVICNRHQDAGEAAFYMPGQPEVWCEGVGSRPTAFDYFDERRPDYAHLEQVFYVGGHVDLFMAKFGYSRKLEIVEVQMPGMGKNRSHTATRLMK